MSPQTKQINEMNKPEVQENLPDTSEPAEVNYQTKSPSRNNPAGVLVAALLTFYTIRWGGLGWMSVQHLWLYLVLIGHSRLGSSAGAQDRRRVE